MDSQSGTITQVRINVTSLYALMASKTCSLVHTNTRYKRQRSFVIDKNYNINTKDLSTESKNKINNGIPSDSWYLKIFKRDADEVKQLQLAAKRGRLSASGARRVIKLYNKHQEPLAPKFLSYLKFVIASWHNKAASAMKASVNKVRDTTTILAEYMNSISEKESQGLVEYYRDAVGRVQIRYL